MFHNYFFLKRLASELNEILFGKELLDCFSQNKDELILGFADKNSEFYIKATLDSRVGLLFFMDSFKRAKKNSVDLFGSLIGSKIRNIDIYQFERSFFIEFDSGKHLIFKMHGSRSNILLSEEDSVKEVFRNNLPLDKEITPSKLNKPALSRTTFNNYDGNPKEFLPALGKEINAQLKNEGYYQKNLNEKWSYLNQKIESISTNPISIISNINSAPELSILQDGNSDLWQTKKALEAANKLYWSTTKWLSVDVEKITLLRELNKSISKTTSYITKTKSKLDEVRNQRSYEEIANIIMANLHRFEGKHNEIALDDFYNSSKIIIKIKPNTSPQKQAEKLYNKAKNRKIEIGKLEENLENKQLILDELTLKKNQIEKTTDAKELKSISKTEKKKEHKKEQNLPYHLYQVDQYEVLVGKNAKANDELTTRYTSKNDLWLHAKDVPGSHVVIKKKNSHTIPANVLEKAAELAAWFSKRKSDSLCPVIHTERKYVRKVKGSPAGAVFVAKENVILVVPRNHPNQN